MRWYARSAALILALVSLSLAQEAPDPFLAERILAQNALVHLSLPQTAAIADDYSKSNLHKLIHHPEVRGFVASFETWFHKRKTQPSGGQPPWNEMAREAIGLTIDEVWDLLQGPLSFTVYDVPVGDPHKLDLVLTLGAPDAGKLEKAAAALKEAAKRNGNVKEGEFAHGGATIREFGDNNLRLYYTVVQKTLIVTTQQARIEQTIDAAANPAFAGLRDDAVFKAARARVAPENRHFFLFYANLGHALKTYRRPLGDDVLKGAEVLGLADVPSIAMSLGYDGPFIRERFALMTSRQDRGLVKLLAGKAAPDPFVSKVPATATAYSSTALNLGEVYDVVAAAAKANPEFDETFKDLVGKYEARVGFKVREALASVGTTWTSWSTSPPGGGVWPDSLWAVALTDPNAFETALEKALTDGGLPLHELTFRGRRIRYVSIPLQDLFGGMPMPGLDFFSFSTTICYTIEEKTLYLSSHPMALKRLILRGADKIPTILENPTYAALAARLEPEDGEARTYIDIGRAFVPVYGLLEPFSHLLRDQARDENGDLVVDLAKLPLEETLTELIGGLMMSKRTQPDGIRVDTRSNTGASVTTGVALVGIGAAVAIPRLMGGNAGGPGGVAGNEMMAEVSLQFIRNAQETFKNSDSDANGVADYWTRDVAGLHSLKDRSGQAIFLLDPQTAAADPDGAARYGLTAAPKNGYFYKMMVTDAEGGAYQKDDGKTNKTKYGVVAWPAIPGATGRFTFITNESGKIWKKDTLGEPVNAWPGADPSKDGWTLTE